ncbi:MAG: RNA polymerase sporulation sigma factor SigK [Lachnospiraceae bacterium]|nr:RNA polymerase sporulation sigma factor SigK [Lachnospiraceae bacterium]
MEAFREPLTKEEEAMWLERFRDGDQHAKDVLVERNLRLVAHIVKKYGKGDGVPEDLLSIGTIGLIKAVNSFDDSKGIRLGTYASKCIDNEILMHLRSEKKRAREVSLYEPIGTDKEGNAIHLLEIIECEEFDVVADYDKFLKLKWLGEKFKQILDKREQEIITLRYGLAGGNEITQRELASKLNISRSYVSRIEKKALEKLKEDFYKQYK